MTERAGEMRGPWAAIEIDSLSTSRSNGAQTDGAQVTVRSDQFDVPGVAFAGPWSIHADIGGLGTELIFSGIVSRVSFAIDPDHEPAGLIELINVARELEEEWTLGDFFENVPAGEQIHIVCREAGLPESTLNIDGSEGTPDEWVVAARIRGVSVDADRGIAGVRFTNKCPTPLADPARTPPVPLVEYFGGPSWAVATATASSAHDAYTAGMESIRVAVAMMRLLSSHQYPRIRGGLRAFDRDATLVRVRLGPEVFVRGTATTRGWLHSSVRMRRPPSLILAAIRGDDGWQDAVDACSTLRSAMLEWQRSADALDELSSVSHLWRSVEWYVGREQRDRMFSRGQLRGIRGRAIADDGLSAEQRKRIEDVIGRLNEPPLLARLRAKLEADDIQITDAEFETLASTRNLRNGLEHGRDLTPLEHRALDSAMAIVNHILCMAATPRS